MISSNLCVFVPAALTLSPARPVHAEFDVIGTVNALEQRLEDIITPMDVSIIGCVVNGPGEALVSTLGVTGGNKKSGLYEDGVRKDRPTTTT